LGSAVGSSLYFRPKDGFSVSISHQWNQAYKSTQSNYPGRIDPKSLFDVMAGYNFGSGFKIQLSAVNLFNNKFSALPGIPKIGKTFTSRLLYDF
jgi:outer membrane receptor protein involved in Fe transport